MEEELSNEKEIEIKKKEIKEKEIDIEKELENDLEKEEKEKEKEKEEEKEKEKKDGIENETPYEPFVPDSKKKRKYTTPILDDDQDKNDEVEQEEQEDEKQIKEKENDDKEGKETTSTTTTTTNTSLIKPKKEKKEKKVKKKRVKKSIEEKYEEIEPTEVNNYTLGDLVKKRIIGDTMKSTLDREKATRDNQQQILNHHRRSIAQQKAATATALLNGEEPPPFNGDDANAPAIEFVNGQLVIKQNNQDDEYTMGDAPVLQDGQDHITNNSFSKRTPSKRWSETETQDFFTQLKRYGTDFSVLEKVFPHRTRRQLKCKFKKEQRENPNLLDDILKGRIDYNIEDFKKQRDQVAKQQKDREEQKKKIDDLLRMGEDLNSLVNEDEDDEEYRNSINKGADGGSMFNRGGGMSGGYRPAAGKYQEEVVMDSQTYESQQQTQQTSQNYDPYSMENDTYNLNDDY
ncbi:hypothetical protein RB653_001561 [Dictyostelium firmibasis]|uniref:Myb-like domain-containing protein n=1 Tax=Dictyostelium firmibasis TaxID=79012 RepID=A0AAN7YWR0_9MYCE